MDIEQTLLTWLLVWLAAASYLMIRRWRSHSGVGLVLVYVVTFGTIHWLAPMLMLLPSNQGPDMEFTVDGLRESALAMVMFAIGAEVAWQLIGRRRDASTQGAPSKLLTAITTAYLATAVLLYVFISPLAARLPSIAALVAAGSTLMAVAVGLKCWSAWLDKRTGTMWLWVASTAVFPIVTVLMQGFLGYGYAAALVVLGLVASFYPRRLRMTVFAMLLAYGGLSIYVTYMRDRTDIRETVWGGASMDDRLTKIRTSFEQGEWFNPWDPDHFRRINGRLNQSFLVGAAVSYLSEGRARYAAGGTLVDAALAIVPRALWPNKPETGGSGDLVTTYTGIKFAEGTSVGVGHVLELYVNFATPGVLVGFFVVGFIVAYLDRASADRLVGGDAAGFMKRYMPGLSLLQVGGSLAEVVGTAAASYVLVVVVNRILLAVFRINTEAPARPAGPRPLREYLADSRTTS